MMVAKHEGTCERCGRRDWVFHTGKRFICATCWIHLFDRTPR